MSNEQVALLIEASSPWNLGKWAVKMDEKKHWVTMVALWTRVSLVFEEDAQ